MEKGVSAVMGREKGGVGNLRVNLERTAGSVRKRGGGGGRSQKKLFKCQMQKKPFKIKKIPARTAISRPDFDRNFQRRTLIKKIWKKSPL